MANNYMQFCEEIGPLTTEQVTWLEAQFDEDAEPEECIQWPPCDTTKGQHPDKSWAFYVIAEEGGDIEGTADILQRFLGEFPDRKYMTLSWAETCSKMRAGEFCGGSVFITKDAQHWNSSYTHINEMIGKHERGEI